MGIVQFHFFSGHTFKGEHRTHPTDPIEGDIWPVGGESGALIFGISFDTGKQKSAEYAAQRPAGEESVVRTRQGTRHHHISNNGSIVGESSPNVTLPKMGQLCSGVAKLRNCMR